jgi:hypothetical protein
MLWIRITIALFILAHGFGHSIWFLSSRAHGDGLVDEWPWALPGRVTISSPIGRLFGLLAMVAAVGFVIGAFGLFYQQAWWRLPIQSAPVISAVAVLPWAGRSPGSTVPNAVLGDVALLALALQPWSAQLAELG